MSAPRSRFAPLFTSASCAALCGVFGGGCVAPPAQTRAPAKPSSNDQAASQSNARTNRALDDLARAVKTWSNTPPSSGARAATAKTPVSIDVAVLARQHPAWRLADALERENFPADKPIDRFSATRINLSLDIPPIIFRPDTRMVSVAPGFAASRFSPALKNSSVFAPPISSLETANFASRRIEARALPRALDVARRRQDNAFLAFLNDAATRQKNARFDAAETQRLALDAQIDAARHASLDELSPPLLADPVALELTNLKLNLLTASSGDRPTLLRRIAALEAPWQARLREQEKARQEELRELRRTRPFQLEREGNARIAAFLKDTQRDDTALRTNLRATHSELVRADFAPDNAILGIALPELDTLSTRNAPLPAVVSKVQKQLVSIETFAPNLPSQRAEIAVPPASVAFGSAFEVALPAGTPRNSQSSRRQEAHALRLQALRDSRLWAQATARRNGWTLVPQARGVRDETRSAMRFLNVR